MPAKDWTEEELNILIRALVTPHLSTRTKRAVASEIRKQCMGPPPPHDPIAVSRRILAKLGYDNLRDADDGKTTASDEE
jgi:hypothetical protein